MSSCYLPDIDFPGAKKNSIDLGVVNHASQSILRTVAEFIDQSLNTSVCANIPNLHHFVSSKTDEMVAIFVDAQLLH